MTPRITFPALVGTALLLALPLAAEITNTNATVLRVATVKSFPGRTVTVPVTLTHTGGVSGVQLDLNYPAAKLMAGAYQAGGLSNNVVLRSRQVGPGRHRLLVYSTGPNALATNQPLGAMTFTLPAGDFSAGGPIALTDALASRNNATAASPLLTVSGAVKVSPIFVGEDGVVDLALRVLANRTYIVQASTNFVNWVNISTNFADTELLIAADMTLSGLPMRFYRGVSIPVGDEPAAQLSVARVQGGDRFVFDYATVAGRTYVVQGSTNLATWSNLATNMSAASSIAYTNLVTPAKPQEFFRVVELR